jgi:hypothetical protein
MVTRTLAALCFGFVAAAVPLSGQSPAQPVVIAHTADAAPAHYACAAGYAEIVSKHFRVTQEPNAPLLHLGTLKVTARRGSVEEPGSKPISYRAETGTLVPDITVPIVDGALEHPACVPFTSFYGPRAMRYQMTVTDDSAGSKVLLLVTADLTDPQYFLDDDALYRVEPTDGDTLATNSKASRPAPSMCQASVALIVPKSCGPK